MTTRAQLISKIDIQLRDQQANQVIDETGNGSETIFQLSSDPIVPDSQTIKLGGATTTAYTMENENGRVVFNTAVGASVAITGTFKTNKYSAQAKIDALNDVLTGGFLFKEVYDDYSKIPNGIVIADFESDESWSAGAADTARHKTGTRGLRISDTGSGTTASLTGSWNMRGVDNDKIRLLAFAQESANLSSAIIRFHTTAGTAYYSYTFTGDISDGDNVIEISRSSFTKTGSADWGSIVRVDLIVTGTSNGIDLVSDQLTLLYSDTKKTMDLPSSVRELLEVQLYPNDGEYPVTLRNFKYKRRSGQSSVDQIEFESRVTGYKLGIRYATVFNALETDGEVTDLPTEGERPAVLMTASIVLATVEPERLLSGKDLGYKSDADGAREMSHIRLADYLEQKAFNARASTNLDPSNFIGISPIYNN